MGKREIRLKYSGFVVFASKLFSVATGFAFTYMIYRSISAEVGIVANINDLLGYFTLLAGIISFWTVRFVAREHAGSAKTGLVANVVISIISVSIYLPLLPFMLPALNIPGTYLIVYVFASFEILELYTLSALQAISQAKQPQIIGYGILVHETCKVILGFFLIMRLQLGLLGMLYSLVIAYFVQIALFIKFTAEELKGSFNWNYLKEWLKASPINLYNVVGSIIPGFALIFLFVYAEYARGCYFAASTVTAVIGYSGYLIFGLYPKLLSKINIADVSTSLKMLLMLAIPMTSGAIVLSSSYLTIFDPTYADASLVLSILAVSTLSASLYGIFDTIVAGTERIDTKAKIPFKQLMKTSLFKMYTLSYIYAAIVLSATFFFLSYVAKTAIEAVIYVAAITMIANIAMLIFKYVISHRCLAFKIPWRSLAKYVFASVVMVILLLIVPRPTKLLSTILLTGVGGIVYFFTLAAIDRETRRTIKLIINEAKFKLGIQ